MAVFRIEKNKDYVVMSNHPLRDKRILLNLQSLRLIESTPCYYI